MVGNMPADIYNAVRRLDELGFCDDRLWRMQEMVAQRIERAYPAAFAPR